MAPFVRPELAVQQLDRLTMAQFLPQGLESVPTLGQIRDALRNAGSGDSRTLTKAQAELARVLLLPESNELVFRIATAGLMPYCDEQGRCVVATGGLFGPMIEKYLEWRFGEFQTENPKESLLKALAAGRVPWLLQ
jgi:hypothetical protein